MPTRTITRRRAGVVVAVVTAVFAAGTGGGLVGKGWNSPDTSSPNTYVKTPAASATVTTTSLTAEAKCFDNVGCSSVQFQLDGVNVGTPDTDGSNGWTSTLDVSTLSGSHTIRDVASDAAFHQTTSAAVSFTVTIASGGGAQVFVSTSGSDSTCVRNDVTKPCLSFNKAYQVANSGDTIQVACGTYVAQELDKDATKTTSVVTIRPPVGQDSSCVNVPRLSFGSIGGDGSTINQSADYVTVNTITVGGAQTNPTIDNQVLFNGSADHDTVTNSRLTRFEVVGASNITIGPGNDIGQCKANGNNPCNNRFQTGVGNSPPNLVTVTGNTFHQIGSSDFNLYHIEAIAVFSGTNLTFTRNKFWGVALMNIFWQGSGLSGMTVTNNMFGTANQGDTSTTYGTSTVSNGTGVWFGTAVAGVYMGFNTFMAGASIVADNTIGTSGSPAEIVGNIVTVTDALCGLANQTFRYNIDLYFSFPGNPGAACSGTDSRVNPAPTMVSNTSDSSIDGHLSGANGAADNFVPTSVTGGCVAVDYDGTARPVGSSCDAGADER